MGTAPKRGKVLSETNMYHRAKFQADRCHRHRDICNRTDTQNYSTLKTHTRVASVENNIQHIRKHKSVLSVFTA